MRSLRLSSVSCVALAALSIAVLVPPSAEAQFTYKKYLEPPDGTLIQGMGNWPENNEYMDALAPGEPRPAFEQRFVDVANDQKPIEVCRFKEILYDLHCGGSPPPGSCGPDPNQPICEGRIPLICIDFRDWSQPSGSQFAATAHDDDLADETGVAAFMHTQLDNIGQAMKEYQDEGIPLGESRPIFCRIGTEFNNQYFAQPPLLPMEDYTSVKFPIAYQKAVDALRAKGARCAYIWCWQASALPTYLDQNPSGEYLWWPGGTYVDWFGLDTFNRREFIDGATGVGCPGPNEFAQVEDFLEKAVEMGYPVFVETSAVDVLPNGIVSGPDDTNGAISQWFVPFLLFVYDHPVIKAVDYVSHDWTGCSGGPCCWKNATLSDNGDVMEFWIDVMENTVTPYLGADAVGLLNGYDGWYGLNEALAGAGGEPALWGTGPVRPDKLVTLDLTNANPGATCALYTGYSIGNAPFKGGVLVPAPAITTYLTVSPAGTITLPFVWPTGLPAFTSGFFQYWIVDGGGPQGYAASNAVEGRQLE